jgi:hypothetical protein
VKHNNIYAKQEPGDEEISNLMNSLYESIDIPDEEASYHLFQKRLARAKIRSRRFKILRTSFAIAACSLLIISFNGQTRQSYAFSNFFNMAKEVQEGFVYLIYGNKDSQNTNRAKTPPPPDSVGQKGDANQSGSGSGLVQPEQINLEEAANKLDFPLLIPQRLPAGYYLKRATIYPDSSRHYDTIRIEYVDAAGSILFIVEKKMNDNGSSWQTAVSSDAGSIKEVKINGHKGQLIAYKEGGVHVEWLTGDTVIQVHGKITEEQIMDLSNSFQ